MTETSLLLSLVFALWCNVEYFYEMKMYKIRVGDCLNEMIQINLCGKLITKLSEEGSCVGLPTVVRRLSDAFHAVRDVQPVSL